MAKKLHNILITGGAGYIGSHVSYLLIEKGYNVTNNELNVSRGFDVSVSCTSGYKSPSGGAPTAIPCTTSGPYKLTGCLPRDFKPKTITFDPSSTFAVFITAPIPVVTPQPI